MKNRLAVFKSKIGSIGLKWRVFIAFAGFVIFAIALLWVLQTFFLDSIYRQIKIDQIKNVASDLEQSIDSDFESELNNAAENSGLCIHVFDSRGHSVGSAGTRPFCVMRNVYQEHFIQLLDKARDNDGTYFAQLYQQEPMDRQNDGDPKSVGYFLLKITDSKFGERIIVIDAAVTPLDSTVSTLQYTLIITTVVAIAVAAVIAVVLSKHISSPIEKINVAAKGLAEGKFEYSSNNNIPEIAELTKTLSDAAVEISRTEDLKRELFANVSHDLRTPLTMITGYAEAMRDIPGENTPENVQVVIDEANRLTRLVNDMLDLSRLQSITGFDPEICNVTELIADILNRYNKMRELQGFTVEFIFDRDVFVLADELRLSQVVYNLVNNAIDFTGSDKKVTVRQTVKDKRVKIEVIDSGEGIPQDKLQHIWERYYKVDKEHKRSRVGTGLGLSIVKEALVIHGARFGVESGPNGSNFWFELEIADKTLN